MTKLPQRDFYDEAHSEFTKWFEEDLYGPFSFRIEHFYGDCEVKDVKLRTEYLRKWIASAFQEGYERGRYAELEIQQNQFGGTE
jgi:hypothetical protein